jgi:hypothetical protein
MIGINVTEEIALIPDNQAEFTIHNTQISFTTHVGAKEKIVSTV